MKYAIAAGLAVTALLLRNLLNPVLGSENPYHTVWLAVMVSAFYCGVGPAITATLISGAGVWYWLLPSYALSADHTRAQIFGMAGFLILSVVIIAFGESTRRLAVKRQQVEEELTKTHAKLEERVKERTAALEERKAELEQKTSEIAEQAAMLDLANDAIFVRSASGTISYWNKGAERLYGWTRQEAIGSSPHDLLHTEFPQPLENLKTMATWEGELRHTKRDGTKITVASHWTTLKDRHGTPTGWLEINTDITRREQAEDAMRALSGRILTLQDEERRRIARGLHDSLGQYLAALKMNLQNYESQYSKLLTNILESSDMVDKCLAETRTISHLLHPPLLDEAGFASAARDYIEGFSRRSRIAVEFDTPSDDVRLHHDTELTLFRAVQESLTNVHKHAGASRVVISLRIDDKQAHLKIRDDGMGISPDRLEQVRYGMSEVGVGLAGMRERVRQLDGAFDIQSDGTGTLITVTVPRLDLSVAGDSGTVSAA